MYKLIVIMMLSCGSVSTIAANLGNYGTIYPIAEKDLLHIIHERLIQIQADGTLQQMQMAIQKKILQSIARPSPTILPKATQEKIHYYIPLFIVPYDIRDANGHVIFKQGMAVNALDTESVKSIVPYSPSILFNEVLLFINADDPSQIMFAQYIQAKTVVPLKIILVQGNVFKAEKKLGRVYFDQSGVLIHQLGIYAVPSLVTRDHNKLKIVAGMSV